MMQKCSHIKNNGDMDDLQTGILEFVQLTDKWQVKLNTDKCKVISFHDQRYSNKAVVPNYCYLTNTSSKT